MNFIKTEKGTSLPLLNLKGKSYLPVAQRLVWFRERHPIPTGASVIGMHTVPVEITPDYALFKAEVLAYFYSETQGNVSSIVLGTGHKREDAKHFPDYIEKAETGAKARALTDCGIGTQFAPELDEGERVVDAPIASPSGSARGSSPWT